MNPVLILTRNNLELTKKCVDSVRAQDIPATPYVWDNSSTDGTADWIFENIPAHNRWSMLSNHGVSYPWNEGLGYIFEVTDAKAVLVLNNDALIPRWYLSQLVASAISYDCEFVTGVAVDYMPTEVATFQPANNHPDFSSFLIGRNAWDTIGKFDERMKIYCSDCDYHIRGHKLGVPMLKANVPYYHVNSQTLKRADPSDREAIQTQANKDREVFKELYGCLPGTPEYQELFK
jgi:GT2 family glycosyltransferase